MPQGTNLLPKQRPPRDPVLPALLTPALVLLVLGAGGGEGCRWVLWGHWWDPSPTQAFYRGGGLSRGGLSSWIRGSLVEGEGRVSGGCCPTPASLSAEGPPHKGPSSHPHPLTQVCPPGDMLTPLLGRGGGALGVVGANAPPKRAALQILPPRKPCSNCNCNSPASRAGS